MCLSFLLCDRDLSAHWGALCTLSFCEVGGCLTEGWGSGAPMTAASPAASGPPSGEGNSLRLQVLLRLEHREWEEVPAWERQGEG